MPPRHRSDPAPALRRALLLLGALGAFLLAGCAGRRASDGPVRHAFLACGPETRIVEADGRVSWSHPESTRDGWVLPDGRILLALSRSDRHPGGAVVETTRDGRVTFLWEGTQSEVNTCQPLPGGRILVTEAGPRPRILELDRSGAIRVEVALRCQTTNHHMQSRMTRKLANGNYLVPQLLDKVVREYAPDGRVVWEFRTPEDHPENWPFTAIRLPDGHTLVTCTHGNQCLEVDRDGRVVWRLTNADLPRPLLRDPCGAQRLANGNTVITSYGAGDQTVKLLEVTRARELVWTHEEARPGGIHHFQILGPGGRPPRGPAWR